MHVQPTTTPTACAPKDGIRRSKSGVSRGLDPVEASEDLAEEVARGLDPGVLGSGPWGDL
jgi:hypothetical protein